MDEILHDNGAMLLFYPNDNKDYHEDFKTFYGNFGFQPFKEWLGINHLPLWSTKLDDVTTNWFKVMVFERVMNKDGPMTSTTIRSFTSKFFICNVLELLSMDM